MPPVTLTLAILVIVALLGAEACWAIRRWRALRREPAPGTPLDRALDRSFPSPWRGPLGWAAWATLGLFAALATTLFFATGAIHRSCVDDLLAEFGDEPAGDVQPAPVPVTDDATYALGRVLTGMSSQAAVLEFRDGEGHLIARIHASPEEDAYVLAEVKNRQQMRLIQSGITDRDYATPELIRWLKGPSSAEAAARYRAHATWILALLLTALLAPLYVPIRQRFERDWERPLADALRAALVSAPTAALERCPVEGGSRRVNLLRFELDPRLRGELIRARKLCRRLRLPLGPRCGVIRIPEGDWAETVGARLNARSKAAG